MPATGPEQRRHPRIALSERHDVHFEMVTSKGALRAKVSDIAKGGLGILGASLSPEVKAALQSKTIFPAKVKIRNQVFDVEVAVVFASAAVVGCAFHRKPDSLDAEIESYFKLELGALKMKRVDSASLKPVADGEPHWIFGAPSCELYFVKQGERLVRFNATFFSNYVEARSEAAQAPRYGKVVATQGMETTLNGSPDVVHWVDGTPELRKAALQFLAVVPGLSDDERGALLRWVHTGTRP